MIKILKRTGLIFGIIIIIFIAGLFIIKEITDLPDPEPVNTETTKESRTEVANGIYVIGNNWFRKNNLGIYELYTEGDPFSRGVITGKLTRELIQEQEEYFLDQIETIIPSRLYLRFLKFFISWFNRNLDQYVDPEYLE